MSWSKRQRQAHGHGLQILETAESKENHNEGEFCVELEYASCGLRYKIPPKTLLVRTLPSKLRVLLKRAFLDTPNSQIARSSQRGSKAQNSRKNLETHDSLASSTALNFCKILLATSWGSSVMSILRNVGPRCRRVFARVFKSLSCASKPR